MRVGSSNQVKAVQPGAHASCCKCGISCGANQAHRGVPAAGVHRHQHASLQQPPSRSLTWRVRHASRLSLMRPSTVSTSCGSGAARWKRLRRPCTAATRLLKHGQPLPAGQGRGEATGNHISLHKATGAAPPGWAHPTADCLPHETATLGCLPGKSNSGPDHAVEDAPASKEVPAHVMYRAGGL